MNLLLNDLSFHDQFGDVQELRGALGRVIALRSLAGRFGRDIQCSRTLLQAPLVQGQCLPQLAGMLGRDERSVLLQWFTKVGPFWEAQRQHEGGDYFECRGEVVTDTCVGEAAFCCRDGRRADLVSVDPSEWLFTPVSVFLKQGDGGEEGIAVFNHWKAASLVAALEAAPLQVTSWVAFEVVARERFPNLCFAPDAFDRLRAMPYARGVADRLLERFDVLSRRCDETGKGDELTDEGRRIHAEHFVGCKAWFTTSSDGEIHSFRQALTFVHPVSGERVLCPWHGKVKSPQLRIHFVWPIRHAEPVAVVYVGPKITKS